MKDIIKENGKMVERDRYDECSSLVPVKVRFQLEKEKSERERTRKKRGRELEHKRFKTFFFKFPNGFRKYFNSKYLHEK